VVGLYFAELKINSFSFLKNSQLLNLCRNAGKKEMMRERGGRRGRGGGISKWK
jgi:hypothetical protein